MPPLSPKIATAIQPYMPACHAVSDSMSALAARRRGRAASECPFHAPGSPHTGTRCRKPAPVCSPRSTPRPAAPADGDRNEIHKPFPDQIGQRTSRSAMKRGQHRRLPFRPPRHLSFRHVPHAGHSHTRHTCRFTHIFHACRTAHFPHAVSPASAALAPVPASARVSAPAPGFVPVFRPPLCSSRSQCRGRPKVK